MDLEISEERNRVLVEGKWWRFAKPVLQAKKLGDQILVIFDYMTYPKGKSADNLVAFDKAQNQIWKAEQPIDSGSSAYVNFIEESPLNVGNFAGFVCEIDPQSGKLVDALFTK